MPVLILITQNQCEVPNPSGWAFLKNLGLTKKNPKPHQFRFKNGFSSLTKIIRFWGVQNEKSQHDWTKPKFVSLANPVKTS